MYNYLILLNRIILYVDFHIFIILTKMTPSKECNDKASNRKDCGTSLIN